MCPPSWTTVPRYLVQHYPVSKRISLDKIYTYTGGLLSKMDSLVAQMVKNPPAMQDTWIQCLGQEDPLEKGMATYYSILAWRIPWTEEPGGLQSMGSQRSCTRLSDKHFYFSYFLSKADCPPLCGGSHLIT